MEKETKTSLFDWHACHECNLKLGGQLPRWGFDGVTVSGGTCPYCKKPDAVLIPHSDYSWPKLGRKAVFD